ncbi:hypothetical protein [Neobacillus sp. YIM B06451]|uniref:hypothetical protein n=1 Tax=Neobacillus sp. YIM B06451 TaxID=3070994 RepID=UPI00292D00B4|nr:hypothetical protein [Neobacillus sp. YIM B06451]
MSFEDKYINFRCELSFENPNFEKIKNTLISILGQPEERGLLHPFFIANMEGQEEGEGFQLKLTSKNLNKLQNICKELNISFEETFERDWCHLHIDCYLGLNEEIKNNSIYHEGIANEHEDYWEMYYEDGSLRELPGLKENNFLMRKISKNDISNPNKDIPIFFKKWVNENIKKK